MSAATGVGVRRQQEQEMIGALLHSLSQPLTTLCCSLELSMEKTAGQQHEVVATALEQAERVIALVRLLREYLDAELTQPAARPVMFMPVLRAAADQLSAVAAVRQTGVRLVGDCLARVPLPEERLKLALQYLIGGMIDTQPARSQVTLKVQNSTTESILRALAKPTLPASETPRDCVQAILRQARLAIACRLLESAGIIVEISEYGLPAGFLLRLPHPSSRPV